MSMPNSASCDEQHRELAVLVQLADRRDAGA
jgi:hypothetical protein